MISRKWLSQCIILTAILLATGCFTSPKINKIEFARTEEAPPTATSFLTGERIYAIANVTGANSGQEITFSVKRNNTPAESQPSTEILHESVTFEGSRPVWLAFTAPEPGNYTVEATLVSAEGKKIDIKSGSITVK